MSSHVVQWEEGESVPVAVVRAAATMLDMPAEQLPPLGDTIDTDLLDLPSNASSNDSMVGAHIVFDYCGLIVSVDAEGEIAIR